MPTSQACYRELKHYKYQLMRGRHLDHKVDREYADQLLRDICIRDGMSRFRAWYVYRILRSFGERSARPSPERQDEIICVP